MLPYIIVNTNNEYISRTSRFGPFYGFARVTHDITEARRWTREKDVKKAIEILHYRERTGVSKLRAKDHNWRHVTVPMNKV